MNGRSRLEETVADGLGPSHLAHGWAVAPRQISGQGGLAFGRTLEHALRDFALTQRHALVDGVAFFANDEVGAFLHG